MSIGLLLITLKFSIVFIVAIILGFLLKGKKKKSSIKGSVAVVVTYLVIGFIYVYFVMPSQSLNQLLFYNLLGLILGSLFTLFTSVSEDNIMKQGTTRKTVVLKIPEANKKLLGGSVALMCLFLIGTPIIRILSTDEIYQTIPVKKVDQTEELKSTKETPIAMSTKSARNKMQKMMSSVPNYSGYQLGTTTAQ